MKHQLPHGGSNSSHTCSYTQGHSSLLLQKSGDSNAGRSLPTWWELHVHSWPERKLCPGSSWVLNTCPTWETGVESSLTTEWKMDKNRLSPHNVLIVITGSGMTAYEESTHTCMCTHTQMSTTISYRSRLTFNLMVFSVNLEIVWYAEEKLDQEKENFSAY